MTTPMWGDAQGAYSLERMSPLSRFLVQVTGPAHVPVNDSRWEQLLHCYDQLVHLEYQWKGDNVLATCAKNMARHAGTSSNLAALTLHVSRMLQDLCVSVFIHLEQSEQISSPEPSSSAPATTVAAVATQAFSNRIALVGKARASCGGLNLLRILIHELISSIYASSAQTDQNDDDVFDDTKLEGAFLYRSRETYQQASKHSPKERDVTMDLISSLLTFVASMGGSGDGSSTSGISAHSTALIMETIPELYDVTVQSLQLILVLLSTQLYQPLISSTQQKMEIRKGKKLHTNYFLDKIMLHGRERQRRKRKHQKASDTHGELDTFGEISSKPGEPLDDLDDWSPQSVLKACLAWLIQRPHSPPRSISYHHAELAQSVVQARNERIGPDGMYEHYAIVMAENSAAHAENSKSSSRHGSVIATFRKRGHGEALRQVRAGLSRQSAAHGAAAATVHGGRGSIQGRSPAKLILDATKGVLVLSSTLILLPFRLMSLALGLWGNRHHHYHLADGHDKATQARLLELSGPSDRTNNVLWLSDSPIADLGSALFLILLNNHRVARGGSNENNPFRREISSLDDNRWEGPEKTIPDILEHDSANGNGVLDSGIENGDHVLEFAPSTESMSLLDQHTIASAPVPRHMILSVNFESLFESFGYIVHTEVGSLVLYSLLQSSPIFAASVAVRSDLDTLVLPLLRTLYYSTVVTQYHHPASHKQSTTNDLSRSCPFRSPSQLYLILILLLLFSQDASFGPDAFRRVTIPSLPWYKERKLKDINLGSVLILSLLRALTFNLSRLRDGFLLSNCCAVLLNLSPHMVNINEYTAMRLGSITMSFMRKYAVLLARNGGTEPDEGDVSTVTGMYGEVCRTLLHVIRNGVRPIVVKQNLHLVYALVYHQTDFNMAVSPKNSPFKGYDIDTIKALIENADSEMRKSGQARTATQAMEILKRSIESIADASSLGDSFRDKADSEESVTSFSEATGDFTFTYEEEADPEIFFVPYVWEVVVCAVTSSSIEWNQSRIQLFAVPDSIDPDATPTPGGQDEPIENNRVADEANYSSHGDDMV